MEKVGWIFRRGVSGSCVRVDLLNYGRYTRVCLVADEATEDYRACKKKRQVPVLVVAAGLRHVVFLFKSCALAEWGAS